MVSNLVAEEMAHEASDRKKLNSIYTPSPLHHICDHHIPLFDEDSKANSGKAGQGMGWGSFL